ncbi:MAG: hypothetical protein AAFR11_12340 [Pseudomonadota bacterium]
MVESVKPKQVKLSLLRDIGWKFWDPIGLAEDGQNWENWPYADEYDAYLLRASYLLRADRVTEAAEYLLQIESGHMGLGVREGASDRVRKTVDEITKTAEQL